MLSPAAAGQAYLLDPGESSLRAAGGLSWSAGVPAGVMGLETGVTLDIIDFGVTYAHFPEDPEWSPDQAFAFSIGLTPFRSEDGSQSVGAFVSVQKTGYSRDRHSYESSGATGSARALAIGLTAAFPFVVEEGSRIVAVLRPFWMSGSVDSPGYSYTIEVPSELGLTLALGIRADLPGPFSLVAEPGLSWTGSSGWVRGATVGVLLRGRHGSKRRPAAQIS